MGLTFARTGEVAIAVEAAVFDAKAARRRIIAKLYDRAEYLVGEMDKTREGKGTFRTLRKVGMGEESTADLTHVPPIDERNLSTAINTYLTRAEALEKIDQDGGLIEAKGMVGSMLAAIRESVAGVDRMNPTAPKESAK